MAVHEFELFHGIALTKLVRGDRPISLRMIETRPGEAWSAYTINSEVELFLKHSTKPTKLKREKRALAWNFVFGTDQLRQIRESTRPVYSALVCGDRTLKTDTMQVCLLDPDQLKQLIDLTVSSQQSVHIKFIPGKSLRVSSAQADEFIVPRNRFEEWEVPGS